MGDRLFERPAVEGRSQAVQNEVRGLVGSAEVGESGPELVAAVDGDLASWGFEPSTGRIDADLTVSVDDTRAELDRRHVPLADGAGAEDEAQPTAPHPGLIGVGDDRGIGERRRFRRHVMGEVRADQQLAVP